MRSVLIRTTAALAIAAALGFAALFASSSEASACFAGPMIRPAPAPNMESGTDCVWRFPDGSTYEGYPFAFEDDAPIWLLALAVAVVPIGAAVLAPYHARRLPRPGPGKRARGTAVRWRRKAQPL